MTFCQFFIFHDFSRPGFYFFHFPWFSMTVGALSEVSQSLKVMDIFRTLGSRSLSVSDMLHFSGKANTSIHGLERTTRLSSAVNSFVLLNLL